MSMISTSHLSTQQGDALLFSDLENGGEMWTGDGPRSRYTFVKFNHGFRSPPLVTIAIKMIDVDHSANLRYDLILEQVETQGFNVCMKTWADTKIARASINWTAMGTPFYEGDWDYEDLI